LSPVVLSRGTIHAAGPYVCPNVRIHSRAVATNLPPQGAFRGFGAPQSIFALERHMDKVAHTLGLTPEEFRRRNFIHEGETTATSQVIRESVNMDHLLTRALQLSDYHAKRERFARDNAASNGRFSKKRGMGFATFMHGAGFTGSGEVFLQSIVSAEASDQGTNTIFSQIAAEALGLDFDSIEIVQPDTGRVPNSGPTVASRTSMVVGKLVESAVTGLKQTLLGSGLLPENYSQSEFKNACAEYVARFGSLKTSATYQPPPNVQ